MALVGMLPFLLLELGSIWSWGREWLVAGWNLLDAATYLIQIAITVLHLGRFYTKSQWLTAALALQSILLVLRLQYFTQVFKSTKFSFFTTIKGVFNELKPYILFLLLVFWAFATAFHITFRFDQDGHEEYDSIWHAFLAMFEHQYGDIEMQPLYKSKSPAIATALGVVYTFVMGMVLINLIIGVTLQALDKIQEHEGMKMLANQARIIDELESNIPRWLEKRFPEWSPPFIHCLRINPEKLDNVELDSLWSMMGREEPQLLRTYSGCGNGGDEGDEGGGEGEGQHPADHGNESAWQAAHSETSSGGGGSDEAGSKATSLLGGYGGEARLEALQHQMEEQRRLLQQLCRRLEADWRARPQRQAAGAAEE